jgi:hypothetical protein
MEFEGVSNISSTLLLLVLKIYSTVLYSNNVVPIAVLSEAFSAGPHSEFFIGLDGQTLSLHIIYVWL